MVLHDSQYGSTHFRVDKISDMKTILVYINIGVIDIYYFFTYVIYSNIAMCIILVYLLQH